MACSQTKGIGEQDARLPAVWWHFQHGSVAMREGPELTAKGTMQSGGILCLNNFGEIINIKTKMQHSTWNTGEHSEPHSACCPPVQLSRDLRSPQPSPV